MRPKPDLAPTCVVGQPWQFRFHPGPTASAMPNPVRAQVRCETSSCRHAKRMVFSYGSNSLQQLQGRLQAELFSFPAVADGVFLAFAGANQSWAVEDAEVVSTATHFGRNVPNKFAVGGADMLSPILQFCSSAFAKFRLIRRPASAACGAAVLLSDAQILKLDGFEGQGLAARAGMRVAHVCAQSPACRC